MRVSFVDAKGNAVDGPVLMDRIPGPGEEVRLKGESYVIQPEPIRNEQVTSLGNTAAWVVLSILQFRSAHMIRAYDTADFCYPGNPLISRFPGIS